MASTTELAQVIKQVTMEAVGNSDPSGIYYGTVTSENPLQIDVEQKMLVSASNLALCRNVTDYEIEMTVDHQTEEKDKHKHGYKGKKKFTIHNALKTGEKVVLVRKQGGQQYLVIDRVV